VKKKIAVPLTGLFFGILVALAAYNTINHLGGASLYSLGDASKSSLVGEIEAVGGEVEHRLPRANQTETLNAPAPLHNQELIRTGRNSFAKMSLLGGASVRLSENSELTFETDPAMPSAVIGTILTGELEVLNRGTPGAIRLYKNGKELDILIPEKSEAIAPLLIPSSASSTAPLSATAQLSATAASGTPVSEFPPLPPKSSGSETKALDSEAGGEFKGIKDTLSNEEVRRYLQAQSTYFQRCYLNFMTRKSGAGPGSIVVNFNIRPNGKSEAVQIVRSEFTDSTLLKCVVDVIERTPFRAFDSTLPINIVEFPITLE
jgi:hypothetical protein